MTDQELTPEYIAQVREQGRARLANDATMLHAFNATALGRLVAFERAEVVAFELLGADCYLSVRDAGLPCIQRPDASLCRRCTNVRKAFDNLRAACRAIEAGGE